MNPQIDNIFLDNDTLQFTLQNVDVSIANTLRRTILSDIELCVFKTYPYEECEASIEINTTRLNNEILKQRLSCIPIHITDPDFPIENFILTLDEENTTNIMKYVTTEDFKLYDVVTKSYMPQKEVENIFPKNSITNQFIDFVRLRPRISGDIPGEKIKLTCKISKASAKQDYMFNVACASCYGFTQDKDKVDEEWNIKEKELSKNEDMSKQDIEYIKNDWYNLDAKRIFLKNSYDFTVQTVGIFTCYELVKKSCKIIYDSLETFKNETVQINVSDTNIDNSFDIILFEKDHTFGKCLEYLLYTKFYEEQSTLSYIGYQKQHPHDDYSIIRIAYKQEVDKEVIVKDIKSACDDGIILFKEIEQLFIE